MQRITDTAYFYSYQFVTRSHARNTLYLSEAEESEYEHEFHSEIVFNICSKLMLKLFNMFLPSMTKEVNSELVNEYHIALTKPRDINKLSYTLIGFIYCFLDFDDYFNSINLSKEIYQKITKYGRNSLHSISSELMIKKMKLDSNRLDFNSWNQLSCVKELILDSNHLPDENHISSFSKLPLFRQQSLQLTKLSLKNIRNDSDTGIIAKLIHQIQGSCSATRNPFKGITHLSVHLAPRSQKVTIQPSIYCRRVFEKINTDLKYLSIIAAGKHSVNQFMLDHHWRLTPNLQGLSLHSHHYNHTDLTLYLLASCKYSLEAVHLQQCSPLFHETLILSKIKEICLTQPNMEILELLLRGNAFEELTNLTLGLDHLIYHIPYMDIVSKFIHTTRSHITHFRLVLLPECTWFDLPKLLKIFSSIFAPPNGKCTNKTLIHHPPNLKCEIVLKKIIKIGQVNDPSNPLVLFVNKLMMKMVKSNYKHWVVVFKFDILGGTIFNKRGIKHYFNSLTKLFGDQRTVSSYIDVEKLSTKSAKKETCSYYYKVLYYVTTDLGRDDLLCIYDGYQYPTSELNCILCDSL